MNRLKVALEQLDESISALETQIKNKTALYREEQTKLDKQLKQGRTREAGLLAVNQKVAARLDQTIAHVESILRN